MGLEMLAIDAGILAGAYVYHRWIEWEPYQPPAQPTALQIPVIADGALIPMYWGTVRIRTPLLAWLGDYHVFDGTTLDPVAGADVFGTTFQYQCDMFFNCGIPFDGFSTNRLHRIWIGDLALGYLISGAGPDGLADGDGGFTTIGVADNSVAGRGTTLIGGLVEFLNGKPTQLLVDATNTAQSYAGQAMLAAGLTGPVIPAYRGVTSVLFYASGGTSWVLGESATPPSPSFEMSSIPPNAFYSIPGGTDIFGKPIFDANPAEVILDLLTGKYGKLGMDISFIDIPSFTAAAATLLAEGHGFALVDPGGRSVDNIITDILIQIDAAMGVDPSTGKIRLKLIRADYDITNLTDVPVINVDNCEAIENFAAGGWSGLVNKVRITYTNRANDYNDGTATSINQANVVGQDGLPNDVTLAFPGVVDGALAQALCARELSVLSKPTTKMTVICDRSMANLMQGDVVNVLWPEYHLSGGRVFRVASASRGLLADGKVTLDLIEDYFHTWRNVTHAGSSLGGFNFV